jgi:hypothetical protein
MYNFIKSIVMNNKINISEVCSFGFLLRPHQYECNTPAFQRPFVIKLNLPLTLVRNLHIFFDNSKYFQSI